MQLYPELLPGVLANKETLPALLEHFEHVGDYRARYKDNRATLQKINYEVARCGPSIVARVDSPNKWGNNSIEVETFPFSEDGLMDAFAWTKPKLHKIYADYCSICVGGERPRKRPKASPLPYCTSCTMVGALGAEPCE